jgi:acyl-coenzyme A thioesterase PaaI-like protein
MANQRALAMFGKLGGSAAGRWLFSRIVCRTTPYFASISPVVQELAPGRCVATIKHRRKVTNHLGTVHAIACCNLAELCAGVGTEVTVPASMRWIPKGMTVRYLKKATGTLTGSASIPAIVEGEAQDIVVPVAITNTAGERVVEADITMYLSPRK